MIDPDLVLTVVSNRADDTTLRDLTIQALTAQVSLERLARSTMATDHAALQSALRDKDEEVNRLLEMLALASNEAAAYRRLHSEQTRNVMTLSAIATRAQRWAGWWKQAAKRKNLKTQGNNES